jgi:beta-xylosidase
MTWKSGWPVIGHDPDGDGTGEPVAAWTKPRVKGGRGPESPATSDEFAGPGLGLQWQWPANPRDEWWSLAERRGWLRLRADNAPRTASTLYDEPRVLLQKLTGPTFTATAAVELDARAPGTRAGIVAMGRDYAYLALEATAGGTRVLVAGCRDADAGGGEAEIATASLDSLAAQLRLSVDAGGIGRFSFSRDGRRFEPLGETFALRPGVWVGARVGLFAVSAAGAAALRTPIRLVPRGVGAGLQSADLNRRLSERGARLRAVVGRLLPGRLGVEYPA